VELTIAKTNNDALFFAVCVLGVGLAARTYTQRRAGFRTVIVSEQVAAAIAPETTIATLQVDPEQTQSILVAARGLTQVLQFALEEARLHRANLYVLYVREVAVSMPGVLTKSEGPRWQDDPRSAAIMYAMLEAGKRNEVAVVPVYSVSDDPAGTILDLAATLGVDTLILGSPARSRLVSLLKGNVVTEVAKSLPESIRLIIYG